MTERPQTRSPAWHRDETIGRGLIAAAIVSTAVIQPMAGLSSSHAFLLEVPRVGRFTIYPNASAAAVELGVLAAGWWQFRKSRPTAR